MTRKIPLALTLSLAACSSKSAAGESEGAETPAPAQPARAEAGQAEPARVEDGHAEPGPAPARADAFPPGPYRDRDPALAKALVDAGALLLDVRTPEEFAEGHVVGAVNITHTAVLDRIDEIRELQGNDPDKPIVLYCRSGRRADAAKEELLQAGFTRVTNLGGLRDWPE